MLFIGTLLRPYTNKLPDIRRKIRCVLDKKLKTFTGSFKSRRILTDSPEDQSMLAKLHSDLFISRNLMTRFEGAVKKSEMITSKR